MQPLTQAPQRLLSLDILRGITIAAMILVNNPGTWGAVYAPLQHASWHGLTPTDLVFPFFLFIMGISSYLSLVKLEFKLTPALLLKIVKRTSVIFALGFALNLIGIIPASIKCEGNALTYLVENVRVLGVLQRLALCYFFGAILLTLIPIRKLLILAFVLLAGYAVLLALGNGYEFSSSSILYVVDNAILGTNHLYHDLLPSGEPIALDPEGLLSTLPAIAHLILGIYGGYLLTHYKGNPKRLRGYLLGIGLSLLLLGLFLTFIIPLNKKVWSPTFVLVTSGLAMLLLQLLIEFVDFRGYKQWSKPFVEFGTNPLFIYVFATLLAQMLEAIKIGEQSLQGHLFSMINGVVCSNYLASLIYALLFVAVCWGVCRWLYKKGIVIKL
ncbi:MAG: acyltransferase family protein [Bacteroidales bacterium]